MGREFESDREPDVGERPRTDNRGSSRIGTDDAGCAGRAVPRRLQFTQQIVVLERRRREEDGVNRQPDECEAPAREIRESLQIRLTASAPTTLFELRRGYGVSGSRMPVPIIQPRERTSYFGGFSTRLSMKNSIIRSLPTAL